MLPADLMDDMDGRGEAMDVLESFSSDVLLSEVDPFFSSFFLR